MAALNHNMPVRTRAKLKADKDKLTTTTPYRGRRNSIPDAMGARPRKRKLSAIVEVTDVQREAESRWCVMGEANYHNNNGPRGTGASKTRRGAGAKNFFAGKLRKVSSGDDDHVREAAQLDNDTAIAAQAQHAGMKPSAEGIGHSDVIPAQARQEYGDAAPRDIGTKRQAGSNAHEDLCRIMRTIRTAIGIADQIQIKLNHAWAVYQRTEAEFDSLTARLFPDQHDAIIRMNMFVVDPAVSQQQRILNNFVFWNQRVKYLNERRAENASRLVNARADLEKIVFTEFDGQMPPDSPLDCHSLSTGIEPGSEPPDPERRSLSNSMPTRPEASTVSTAMDTHVTSSNEDPELRQERCKWLTFRGREDPAFTDAGRWAGLQRYRARRALREAEFEHDDHRARYQDALARWRRDRDDGANSDTLSMFQRRQLMRGMELAGIIGRAEEDYSDAAALACKMGAPESPAQTSRFSDCIDEDWIRDDKRYVMNESDRDAILRWQSAVISEAPRPESKSLVKDDFDSDMDSNCLSRLVEPWFAEGDADHVARRKAGKRIDKWTGWRNSDWELMIEQDRLRWYHESVDGDKAKGRVPFPRADGGMSDHSYASDPYAPWFNRDMYFFGEANKDRGQGDNAE